MCKWGEVLASQQHAALVPVAQGVGLPRVLGDPAWEGSFMGEGNLTSHSMAAFPSPPLSFLTLRYPVEMVVLC